MKKIILHRIQQKDIVFYSMTADPRLIAKARKKFDAGQKQDVQRPWSEKRVKSISKYVNGYMDDGKKALGIIPNSPIINVKNKLNVQTEEIIVTNGEIPKKEIQYYIMFPETEAEINQYHDQVEILDGQHRIIAFDENYIEFDIPDNMKYEMNFSLFDNMSDKERKEIFMVTNEKQDKVETNLLRYIKKDLGLLKEDEDEIYNILEKFNEESSSPLYHRIAFGADKIRKGYKETQVSKIFKQYGVKRYYDNTIKASVESGQDPVDVLITILNNYLSAWEEATGLSFSDPNGETMTKISGFRYIMCAFADICSSLRSSKKKLYKSEFLKLIMLYPDALGLETVRSVFNDDPDIVETPSIINRKLAFRGEGGTITLAREDVQKVIAYESNAYDGGLI